MTIRRGQIGYAETTCHYSPWGKERLGWKIRSQILCLNRRIVLYVCLCSFLPNNAWSGDLSQLKTLSLGELMKLEVNIVSKTPLALGDSPSAIYVITAQQIQRSSAQSIPDLLRTVPGLSVASIDANKWAVSSRGFNNQLANKLLVMLDGRSVYTPLFSGTYWEVQDLLLEDIERIEVIRGPGASVWGANAVNGVINIITKHSADTQGSLVTAFAGTEQRQTAIRRGGTLPGTGHYRVYAKYRNQDDSEFVDGGDASDHWDDIRGGFRLDWNKNQSTYQLQGDAYRGDMGERLRVIDSAAAEFTSLRNDDIDVSGANLLFRRQKPVNGHTTSELQAYLDHTYRNQTLIEEARTTLDIAYQRQTDTNSGNSLVWGVNYRLGMDELPDGNTAKGEIRFFDPEKRHDQLFGGFFQYEQQLLPDKFWLTLGSKLEHNDYTDFEVQPSVKLRFKPADHSLVWTSVSRAVRVPSRAEHDMLIGLTVIDDGPPPTLFTLLGNNDFEAEELTAWELGYRSNPAPNLVYDLAVFYNDYDNLQTLEPVGFTGPLTPFPSITALAAVDNKLRGETFGLELAVSWSPTPKLSFLANYSFLEMALHGAADTLDSRAEINEEFSPEQQLGLQVHYQLHNDLTLDIWNKYTDQLPRLDIGDYVQTDVSLRWNKSKNTSLVLGARNLLSNHKQQFSSGVVETAVEREFFLKLEHRYPE